MTGVLVGVAIVAALLIEVVTGTSGGASTSSPTSTRTRTLTPGLTAPLPSGGTGIGATNYSTVGTFVNLRSGPGTNTAVVTNISAFGSPVTLYCYTRGTSVAGDPWWYRATYGSQRGYLAGFWVNTGPDPAKTHLPAC